MKTSPNGVALIKRFEGLELEAYQDIAGIWTIGYGHTGPDVKPGMKITEAEAEALLKRDLKPREEAVERLVKVPLNQNEFDALVSFVYNVGIEAFRKSTALRRLNKGDRIGAAEALTWWNKATVGGVLREVAGLTRRRAAERALFLEPVNPPIVKGEEEVAENSRVTPIEDAPRRPNLAESRSVQGATVAGGAGVAASTLGRNTAQELESKEAGVEAPAPAQPGETAEAGEGAPTETTEVPAEPPTPRKPPIEEAQIQLALMILIVLAVLYVVFARIDDWLRYRR
ncbi:lysozyme [Amphiplicatus metriothermophilus]|uniref:Lysozyme n=1 Tax=Amphiplicatus metriothermophilus TaxID=1519374 RepID=A0A239PTC6_9PROT|nr:lysozyme [Amphiplicatus metriothermophilus]MBB5519309.1 lysozyme [Amphiplicatus metriothermophilus]SNT73378.1 lysozyme [Amphiplicatus metriothermophilus]